MVDVLTQEQRQLNMSHIRGRNTKPEMILRRGLHARGLRFRLHHQNLPGRPDLVFPSLHAVIFVHGCFWHDHRCALCKTPATRTDFWVSKITRNAERDRQAIAALIQAGWRVLVVWECAVRGAGKLPEENVLDFCESFVRNPNAASAELAGTSMPRTYPIIRE